MDDLPMFSFEFGDGNIKNPTTANREHTIYDWTIDELKTLCSRIKDSSLRLNKAVNAPYTRTEKRLDWESIAFGGHDADECHTKWQQVCANIRTFRTMAEIVEDAEQWLQKGPRKAKEAKVMGKSHPDKPSRPATVFIKFLMEQLPVMKKKYPRLQHRQIVSKIGEMYKNIPPEKLDKLKAEFLKEQEAYRTSLEKFYNEHPDVAPSKGPANATPKGTSGLAFFIAEKSREPKHADASKDDLRAKWSKLKDEKKIPYIEMALEAHRKNAGVTHFMAKPSKDVLSKEERIVYDRFLGKPEKPPTSGFALYKGIVGATTFKDMSAADRNQEVLAAWNRLSKPDQNKFNNEAKIIKQQYEKKMAEYLERLAQREQELSGIADVHLSSLGFIDRPDTSHVSNGASAPKRAKWDKATSTSSTKPVKSIVPKVSPKKVHRFSALTWYQESHLEAYKEENPEFTDQELREAIAEHFAALSEEKKLKWARKAEKENKRRLDNATA